MTKTFLYTLIALILVISHNCTVSCSEAGTSSTDAIERIVQDSFWSAGVPFVYALEVAGLPWAHRNLLIVLGTGETEAEDHIRLRTLPFFRLS